MARRSSSFSVQKRQREARKREKTQRKRIRREARQNGELDSQDLGGLFGEPRQEEETVESGQEDQG